MLFTLTFLELLPHDVDLSVQARGNPVLQRHEPPRGFADGFTESSHALLARGCVNQQVRQRLEPRRGERRIRAGRSRREPTRINRPRDSGAVDHIAHGETPNLCRTELHHRGAQ